MFHVNVYILIDINMEHKIDNQLSDKILDRLSGFLEEVQRLSFEINSTAGNASIWKDRRGGGKIIVDSCIDQLIHLSNEVESLSEYLNSRYENLSLNRCILNLVETLRSLRGASGSKLLRFFKSNDDYVELLRSQHQEIHSRINACRRTLSRL